MKLFITRIIVSIGCIVLFSVPFLHLAKLSHDIRNFGFLDFYIKTDSEFPVISNFVWRLGPIAWWSYLTPCLVAIGIAFRFRSPIKLSVILLYLFAVILNALIIIGAFDPYGKLYKVVGNPGGKSLDTLAVVVNLTAVVLALVFCGASVRASLRSSRKTDALT
jgi:hypothetical protein